MRDGEHADTARTRVGTGAGIAVLFNGRAKQVTHAAVRAMRRALPDAEVLVSQDLLQAERHVHHLMQARPEVIISGGGDGAAMRLINLLHAMTPPDARLPALGMLMLGTGNAWARAVGASPYARTVALLPEMRWPLPTLHFDLVEVEGVLCPFAGVGWDARILNDYQRNLDKRSSQIFGSRIFTRLHTGLGGYLYSLVRYTIPEELAEARAGAPTLRVERLDGEAYRVDEAREPVPTDEKVLYEGPLSIAGAATCPEYGFGIRAFPLARRMPGFINLRLYDRPVVEAVRNAARLWMGLPTPGIHDFFVKRARMITTRPAPFEIGGDAHGERSEIEFRLAPRAVDVVHWAAVA